MARYAALLGSINVGGNRLRMADLKAALERAGFANVTTVGASGNVLFDHDGAPEAGLEESIGALLEREFGFAGFAAIRTRAELAAALAESPFAGEGEDRFVHVHFLARQPSPAQFAQLAQDHAGRGKERLAPGTRALHIDFVDGVAGSKLTSAFMERRLGCRGTARNRNSIQTIIGKFA